MKHPPYNGQEHENFLNWIRELALVQPYLTIRELMGITGKGQKHIKRALSKVGDSVVRHEVRSSINKEELEKLLQDPSMSKVDLCKVFNVRTYRTVVQAQKRLGITDPYPRRAQGEVEISQQALQELQALLNAVDKSHLEYRHIIRQVSERVSSGSLKRLLIRGELVDKFPSPARRGTKKRVDIEVLSLLREKEPHLNYTELAARLGVKYTSRVIYWCKKLGIEKSSEEVSTFRKNGTNPELIRKALEDNPTAPLADIAVMLGYSHASGLITRMKSAGIVDRFKDTRPRRKAYLPKYRSMLESALADPELKSLSYSNILERVGILHFVGTGALSSAIWRGTITDAFREHRISVNLRGRPTRSKKEKASE